MTEEADKSVNVAFSEAIDLAGMLSVQEGSVVSRTLLRKETGTVTVFAFDEGQGLSTHSAPYDALVYIVAGEAEVTISGAVSIVKAGQLIVMPADAPHALKALKPFKMMLVMIKS